MEQLRTNQYDIAHFRYGGRYSHEMGLTISADTTQTSPAYDVQFQTVPGRDGDLAMDNKRLESFIYPIRTMLQRDVPDIHSAASAVSQWLKSDVRYKELTLSWDPEYIYRAIYYEQFDVEDLLPKFGRISLNFKVHPVKYHVSGQQPVEFTNGMTIHNPELRAAKPLIEIEGVGDIKLQNNGEDWLILTAVDGSIVIDSQREQVYRDTFIHFDKMNGNLRPMFPQFAPGHNQITWTGNVTKITITPRWEAVA